MSGKQTPEITLPYRNKCFFCGHHNERLYKIQRFEDDKPDTTAEFVCYPCLKNTFKG